MILKNSLKKGVILTLSATMLVISMPAQADVFDTKSYKIFKCYNKDCMPNKNIKISKAELAGWNAIVFKKAKINKKQFEAGEKIKITITIDDSSMKETNEKYNCYELPDDHVEQLTIVLKSALSEQEMEIAVGADKRRNSDGTINFSKSMIIKDGMKCGDWIISKIIVNNHQDGPTTVLKNREYMGDNRYPDLSWGHFKVVGTKVDLKSPKIVNKSLMKLKDGKYQLTWKIADRSKSASYLYELTDDGETYRKLKAKKGIYNKLIKKFTNICAMDEMGNITELNTWDKESVYWFRGYNEGDGLRNSKIKVKKIIPALKSIKTNTKNKITLNMKWTKFTPEYVMLYYRAPYGSATKCVMMKADNKSKTKWIGTFNPGDTTHKGTWRLLRVLVKGKNSKGKTTIAEINNKYVAASQQQVKDYLTQDFKNADIKVK